MDIILEAKGDCSNEILWWVNSLRAEKYHTITLLILSYVIWWKNVIQDQGFIRDIDLILQS